MGPSHGVSCWSSFSCLTHTIAILLLNRNINYSISLPKSSSKVSSLLAANRQLVCGTDINVQVGSLVAKELEPQCWNSGTGRAGVRVQVLL